MIPKMEVVIKGSTCGLRENSFTDRRMDMMFMGKKNASSEQCSTFHNINSWRKIKCIGAEV